MKEKIKVNNLRLWIIFGFAWFVPKSILFYLPENYHWINIPILILSGVFIVFTDIIGRWLIK